MLLLALCPAAFGEDVQLDALLTTLAPMRQNPLASGGPRGATSQLTVAKHQLRDWVESRLPAFDRRGDEGEFQGKLNSELHEAKLFCGAGEASECNGEFLNGFLGHVTVKRASSFLILQTALGIECGFDESAYVYSWSAEGWRRVWQTEQTSYTSKDYKPQRPPYQFTMVQVNDRASLACTEEDRNADEARTFFPR